ncbi:MAG: response regulator transcription factor [Burkholderiales bacterium]
MPCKVPIVDDHALIRDAMRAVVMEMCRDAFVLEASNAIEALTLAASYADIDLVLLDVGLPDRDGLTVLADLRRRYPGMSVAMLSGTKDQQTIMRALSLGAVGFIPKVETRDVLMGVLGLILKGGVYIPPGCACFGPRSAGGSCVAGRITTDAGIARTHRSANGCPGADDAR